MRPCTVWDGYSTLNLSRAENTKRRHVDEAADSRGTQAVPFVDLGLGAGGYDGNLTNLLLSRRPLPAGRTVVGVFYAGTGLSRPGDGRGRAEWEKSGEGIMDLWRHALATRTSAKLVRIGTHR